MAKKLKLRLWFRRLTIKAFSRCNARMSPSREPSPSSPFHYSAAAPSAISKTCSPPAAEASPVFSSPSSSESTFPPPRPSSSPSFIARHIQDLSFLDRRLSEVLALPRPPPSFPSFPATDRRQFLDFAGNLGSSPPSLRLDYHETSSRSRAESTVFCGCIAGPLRTFSNYFRRKLRKIVGAAVTAAATTHKSADAAGIKKCTSRLPRSRRGTPSSLSKNTSKGDRNRKRGATENSNKSTVTVAISNMTSTAAEIRFHGANEKSANNSSTNAIESSGSRRKKKKIEEEKEAENCVKLHKKPGNGCASAVKPNTQRQQKINRELDISRGMEAAEKDYPMSSPYGIAMNHQISYPTSFTSEETIFSSVSRSSRRSFSSSTYSTMSNDGFNITPFISSGVGGEHNHCGKLHAVDGEMNNEYDDSRARTPRRWMGHWATPQKLQKRRGYGGAAADDGSMKAKAMHIVAADARYSEAINEEDSMSVQNAAVADEGNRKMNGRQVSGGAPGRSVVLRRRHQRRRRRRGRRQLMRMRQETTLLGSMRQDRHGGDGRKVREANEGSSGHGIGGAVEELGGTAGNSKQTDWARKAMVGEGGGHGTEERGKRKSGGGGGGGLTAAEVKRSRAPLLDFQLSMAEMIVEKGIRSSEGLSELLGCYLRLNSAEHHGTIVAAFTELVGHTPLRRQGQQVAHH